MKEHEIIFYTIFVIVIVAILLVDLLVFDRHSHKVSLKEALLWTLLWIALAFAFAGFIYLHGEKIHGIENIQDLKKVITKYDYHTPIDEDNFELSLSRFKKDMTLNYITGYLLEKTLSLDNLFVMLLIFNTFNVKSIHYKRVLFWGILGAIILRTLFIFLGAALVLEFRWILYLFGAFLIYSGSKILISGEQESIDPQHHPVVKFLSKHFRIFPRFVGEHFFIRNREKLWFATPLFLVLVFIEISDIIFAFDSIPAIFSVTLDPYIVFFSNIFAILGLRALFFLLAEIFDKFYALEYGVSILLIFIGLKLIFAHWLHRFGFGNIHSLFLILSILTISILWSIIFPQKSKT